MATQCLYMDDCYRKEFSATVQNVHVDADDAYIVLDKTVFYPTGGGQPTDKGQIRYTDESGAEHMLEVVNVQRKGGTVRHYVANPEHAAELENGVEVKGRIDWGRRCGLMRAHTAQHVISAVVQQEYGGVTAGNQIYVERARIDFSPVNFSDEDIKQIEDRCNEIISAAHPVKIYEEERSKVAEETSHRANLELIPDHIDPLRVIEIEGLDLCPCGGTHVKNTEEIGQLTITDVQKKGSDTYRIYFELS